MSDERDGITPSWCPACRYGPMDAAASIGESPARPKPGDLSVCLNCGEFLVFTDALAVRRASRDDLRRADGDAIAILLRASRAVAQRGPLR